MIYITGDTHGQFKHIEYFCKENNLSTADVLIILGDAGINYNLDLNDVAKKTYLSKLPVTIFAIHGNHEARPETISAYKEKEWRGGLVYYEDEFPNLLFAKDGEVYDFDGKKTIVIGGAYSVDKPYRLLRGFKWFEDEQPSEETKRRVEEVLGKLDWSVDVVLSHTVPVKYEPVEVFMPGIDQSKVDKSTEEWLDTIENRLSYEKWYAGHYHTKKEVDRLELMFNSIKEFCK